MDSINDIGTNREYKDRLFKRVFMNKEDLLSLYNAVNGTDYTNAEDIEVNTIEDCVFMSMKNDVSFLFKDMINMYEHQSTQNANLPLRGFMYLSSLYKKSFSKHRDLYASKQIPLPTPQFIVFYNGEEDEPDERYLKMSDAYIGKITGQPSLECTARLLNINYGHNKALMDNCKRLREYAMLVQRVRQNLDQDMDLKDALIEAVDYCIENECLVDILQGHKAEVVDLLFTEYDELAHIKTEKQISYEDGIEVGRMEGKAEGKEEERQTSIRSIMDTMKLSFEEACSALKIPAEEIEKYRTRI